jgi:hypothetical protein
MESSDQVASLYRRLEKKRYDVGLSSREKTRHVAKARIIDDRVGPTADAKSATLHAFPPVQMPHCALCCSTAIFLLASSPSDKAELEINIPHS